MSEKITFIGKIGFEPENITKKHNSQASWKHIAMVFFDGDITEYYSWFINKRFGLKLDKPLRGAHISFINDSFNQMSMNGQRSMNDVKSNWVDVKNKWNGKKIEITLGLSPRTNGKHWWLNIPPNDRTLLHGIRAELGLNEPVFGLHMTIGHANSRNIDHSNYIHTLFKTGLI